MVTRTTGRLVIRPIFRHRVFRLGRDFLAFPFNADRHLRRKACHHQLRLSLHGAGHRFDLRRSPCSASARGLGQLDHRFCCRDFSRYIDGAAGDCRAPADAQQLYSCQCVNPLRKPDGPRERRRRYLPEIPLIQTIRSTQGMAVAPHALASQSALAVLRDGGNAIEAMVAAAATVSIAYPHMNGIGGDAFWLITPQHGAPVAIDAAGPAAARATIAAYTEAGHDVIPIRGPLAMNTVAGAIGSWDAALRISKQHGGQLSLARLLRDADQYANNGIAVTTSQVLSTTNKFDEVAHQPGFAERFLLNGKIPGVGALFHQPKLARVFELLARDGLDSFYRGALAEKIA